MTRNTSMAVTPPPPAGGFGCTLVGADIGGIGRVAIPSADPHRGQNLAPDATCFQHRGHRTETSIGYLASVDSTTPLS
jgi:hypothetical protein